MRELEIEKLGSKGDGIATDGERVLPVPFTLPGERVRVKNTETGLAPVEILDPSSDRTNPPCQHFTFCGGCQVQHLKTGPYLNWKRELVETALARNGIEAKVDGPLTFPSQTRRKCVFSLERRSQGVVLGFMENGARAVVDLARCHVLLPELEETLPELRFLFDCLPISTHTYRLSVLKCDNGLDLSLAGHALPPAVQQTLSRRVVKAGYCRLTINGEILIEPAKPFLTLGPAAISPPPGGFIQAVRSAENAMVSLVIEHLGGCRSVADLFCGVGTFALPLAEHSLVHACEENHEALVSLENAWRGTGGKLKAITVEARNLDRRPLSAKELKRFDGVVFDPPRAGAETQSLELAKSQVVKLAAVSCNPVTLARDLAILLDGGYQIERIMALDQFIWTPHVEVVALLSKPRRRVKRGF